MRHFGRYFLAQQLIWCVHVVFGYMHINFFLTKGYHVLKMKPDSAQRKESLENVRALCPGWVGTNCPGHIVTLFTSQKDTSSGIFAAERVVFTRCIKRGRIPARRFSLCHRQSCIG